MEPPRKFNPHPFAYHQELDVRIENLTNEGTGVARVDGWVVFVPFTLAGERVKCRVFRNHKNYSEADLIEVLEPAPNRVAPKCALFGQCGGCQYQHLAYAEQLQSKQRQVAELLKHMAKIEHPCARSFPRPSNTATAPRSRRTSIAQRAAASVPSASSAHARATPWSMSSTAPSPCPS
jgi:tRNA/tmRNA/rRNA uracil-C5-methylase (TrmA/RlmC/RlmD family)